MFCGKWQRLVEAQSKTLRDVSDEIVALNVEAKKYMTEIGRLRAIVRVNMSRTGATDAEIDKVLIEDSTQ